MSEAFRMHTTARKALLVALFVFMAACLSGCWDRREIEEIGFVAGLAIDFDSETDDIMVTVQIAKPFAIGRGAPGGGSVGERPFWTVQAQGKTVLDAVAQLTQKSPRPAVWAHNEMVVFGEAFARHGIGDALDFLTRHRESRLRVQPLVVRGFTAAYAAFTTESELNPIPSDALQNTARAAFSRLSITTMTNINEVLQILQTDGVEMLLPAFTLEPVSPEAGTFEGELKRESIAYTARFVGSAVFRQDKLVGFFDLQETRGRQWIVGSAGRAVVVVPHPQAPGQEVSLQVTTSSRKITFHDEGAGPSFRVAVDAAANLGDSDSHIDPLDPEIWTRLEHQLEAAIESEMQSALRKAQLEYSSDVFGFGEYLYRRHPEVWARLGPNWDQVFSTVAVETSVNAELAGPGLVFRGARVER
ncbi:MAG: Ger(x)C family spore germination protein [Firmicutes bacterium]|nr:Ger(x)C family spore germination protein [Bacillota bacterium]